MTDYKLCNIVDSQLEDITSEIALPVVSGSTSNTYQQFNAQGGTSNSSMQFQVQIPSMATAVNRHVLAQTDIDIQVDFKEVLLRICGTQMKHYSLMECLTRYRPFH